VTIAARRGIAGENPRRPVVQVFSGFVMLARADTVPEDLIRSFE
jgi:hypothetical protein